MAHIFEEVTGSAGALSFQFNGQFALKNYNVEIVNGNRLKVVSTANEMFSLLEADISEVEINGVTYTDPNAAQIALTSLVHSDAEPVVLTKEQYMALAAAAQGQDRGTIAPDTATPTGGWQVGWYKPTTSSASPGTNYPNQGNQKAISGFSNKLYYDGTTWLMVREKFDRSFLPQFADLSFPVTNTATEKVQCVDHFVSYQLLDGQTSTSADTPSTSPNIWKYLNEINSIVFSKDVSYDSNGTTTGNVDFGTPTGYVDNSGDISFAKGLANYSGRATIFTSDKVIYYSTSNHWTVYGRNTNGDFLAFYPSGTTLNFIYFTVSGTFGAISGTITLSESFNLTLQHFLVYNSNNTISIYQDGGLIGTITTAFTSSVGMVNRCFCLTADSALPNVSYNVQFKQSGGTTTEEGVSVEIKEKLKGVRVIYSSGRLYTEKPKAKDLLLTAYGDSITVAFASANYESLLEEKTGTLVTRVGQSSQSFAGGLQSDTNIANLISSNPDIVVLHCVNDHRLGTTIGTMADASGTASLFGGLKKICNALISDNKNIKIVLCTPLTYGDLTGFPNTSSESAVSGKYLWQYREAMIQFATSYGIEICDLTTKCGFRPQVEGTPDGVYTLDGVHPSVLGYEVMTNIIAETINN